MQSSWVLRTSLGRRSRAVLVAALVAAGLAVAGGGPALAETAGEVAAPDTAALTGLTASGEPGAWSFHFDALEEYRFRGATAVGPRGSGDLATEGLPTEYDHDVRLLLQSVVRDPEDAFSADLSLALWADLDGRPRSGSSDELLSMFDAQDYVWFDVYSLAAQYQTDGVLALVRGGRQTSQFGPATVFDGAHVGLRALKPYLEFFAFGGRTVHFFEVDTDIFEDWIGSGGVVIRPLKGLRFELDYRFLREDATVSLDAAVPREELTEHNYGLTAWYRPLDWLYLKGWVRGIDDEVAEAGGMATFEWVEQEAGLTLMAEGQPATLRALTEQEDPFFAILGESLPHVRARADVWKAFTTGAGVYAVHLGWNGRILTEDDATPFNRDFGRAYLLATAEDIGVRGPFASLALEYHYTHADDFGEDGLFAVGGSVGWDREPVRAEVSTYYQRFKYDYFRDAQEVTDVRTVAADVRYRPWQFLSIRARYELELRSDRDVHTASLMLGQSW